MNTQVCKLSLNYIVLSSTPIWNMHRLFGRYHDLVKDRAAIEKVQHFALRICLKDWSLDYDEALDRAHLPSLVTRRDRAGLCYMYNIVHSSIDFESAPVEPRTVSSFTRHSNSYQLQQFSCHSKLNAFFELLP